jgi:hypothetical protein
MTTSPPSVSRISRKCWILNISQPFGSPWPVTGTALLFLLERAQNWNAIVYWKQLSHLRQTVCEPYPSIVTWHNWPSSSKRSSEQFHSDGNDSDLYLEGPLFQSQAEHRLFSRRFFVLPLSPLRHIMGWYLKLGRDRFLPDPLQFIVRNPTVRGYAVFTTDSVRKWTNSRAPLGLWEHDVSVTRTTCRYDKQRRGMKLHNYLAGCNGTV